MNQKYLSDEQGFSVTLDTRRTFSGLPAYLEMTGPVTLVRLVQFGRSNYAGLELNPAPAGGWPTRPTFWFEEAMLLSLLREARQDLSQQQATAKHPFSTPMAELIGNYVRHCLRADLAICKDWTNDFDAFVRLRLMPEDRLIALVGPVARQPAYSQTHSQHEAVVNKNIFLEGQAKQYVIDFNYPANRPHVGRILGPFPF
jgi:hypothetical protein